MKKFYTKILMLEITSRKGLICWYRKYKTMGKEIRENYGGLTYENYCKYINSKHFYN